MVFSLSVRLLVVALIVGTPLNCLAETVLLDFSSPTCGPCQQMRPTVERLKADGLPVREIDISREPQLAARFGVTRVPTFLVVTDGRVIDRVVGAASYRQLHRMLRRAMPAAPPRQPVVPLGQSPTRIDTSPRAEVAPITAAGIANANSPSSAQDLYIPQPERIISLQDPNAAPPRPQAISIPVAANPFTNSPPRPAAPIAGSLSNAHQRLLAATVKITVDDPQGKSAGTGTIVDTRSGEALVLTCGHIFRSSAGKGQITITTFQASTSGATPGASYAGRLIDFDLERDLALVSMRPKAPVQAVPIASSSTHALTPGAAVTSVGCNHGQDPTAIDSRVTSVDRYQGTPNVEVAGAPVEGRSGGGLFNAQGQLVGVCYAADPQGNEGLYAALPAIYSKLDSLGLTMIYQPNAATPPATSVAQASTEPPATTAAPLLAVRGQEPESSTMPMTTPALPAAEQAALNEIQRRGVNSEVICIIRPQDPSGKSEVITLNNVSPAFVQALANSSSAASRQDSRHRRATTTTGQLLR